MFRNLNSLAKGKTWRKVCAAHVGKFDKFLQSWLTKEQFSVVVVVVNPNNEGQCTAAAQARFIMVTGSATDVSSPWRPSEGRMPGCPPPYW